MKKQIDAAQISETKGFSVGNILKAFREAQGLSAVEIAETLDIGVSVIDDTENGLCYNPDTRKYFRQLRYHTFMGSLYGLFLYWIWSDPKTPQAVYNKIAVSRVFSWTAARFATFEFPALHFTRTIVMSVKKIKSDIQRNKIKKTFNPEEPCISVLIDTPFTAIPNAFIITRQPGECHLVVPPCGNLFYPQSCLNVHDAQLAFQTGFMILPPHAQKKEYWSPLFNIDRSFIDMVSEAIRQSLQIRQLNLPAEIQARLNTPQQLE